jgi:CHAT domain-containing protein
LKPAYLVHTVKHGVMAWAQRVSERRDHPTTFELAATLIGSGGIGMTAGESAQLIVKGVLEANQAIAAADGNGTDANHSWPHVTHLSLVELYLDRAREAWRALKMTSGTEAEYQLDATIASGQGALPRPLDSAYRGTDYDFIRAATYYGPEGKSISYTLDTKRARTETRGQAVQGKLLEELIREAADDRSQDESLRQTLFRLLVPVDLEPFLTGGTEAQLEVDSGTAGIPWELLDDSSPSSSEQPWAIRTKLLRKLRTAEFRAQVRDADAEASVLVVGEPACDPTLYPPLLGAQREARAVADALVTGGLSAQQVRALTSDGDGRPNGPDARTVINALFERDWRIVHIAAHGEPPEDPGVGRNNLSGIPQSLNPRGVVLSNGVYLGPREIHSMRTVPELVFVNCCYLAASDARKLLNDQWVESEGRHRHNRPQFASGVAEALIKVGVRCVIAAGWAVEDMPAKEFATTFYEHLLKGVRFIDAVAAARAKARACGGNTWAAYQCYGDPDWVFRRGVSDGQRPMASGTDPYSVIASARDLVLALQTIAVRCEFQQTGRDKKRDLAEQRKRIDDLERRFAGHWQKHGRVAESFALAWAKAGDERKAFDWYTKALKANDGTASVKAAEQRANLQVRIAWSQVSGAKDRLDGVKTAKAQIDSAIGALKHLFEIAPSMERASLLGSAYKRLAMIAKIEGKPEQERAAIESMKRYYEQGEVIGRDNKLEDFFYPALNRLAAEFALSGGPVALDRQAVDAIRADLDAAVRHKPDFWSVVGQTELRVYESLSRGDLAKEIHSVIAAYDDVNLRVQQEWMWRSVYDQADFVLSKYSNGEPEEKEAASLLIDHLATLSGQPRSRDRESAQSGGRSARPTAPSRARTSRGPKPQRR